MIETLLGSLFGGVFRIAPEILKWLDKKGEREHELKMVQAEMEFAKIRGEIAMREADARMTVSELDAMREALKEQGETARAAGKFIAALSASVRPIVTYVFVGLYVIVKLCLYLLAVQQGGEWKEVLISMWTKDDMAILMLILTFHFVGRTFHHLNNGKG